MTEWYAAFPALRDYTIARDELRFHDRRVWGEHWWNQDFGTEFSREELVAFIRAVLQPQIPRDESDSVVVNVRRGDYYAEDHLRARYGFDQAGYLEEALTVVGPTPRILLVSDDPEWCQENLDDLFRRHADQVDYAPRGPVANFLAVSGARKLVGTNSTFSYWGGYISNVQHRDAVVVMPRFHGRFGSKTHAHQLDPEWTIIDGYH